MARHDTDILIIGGGPAGAWTGMLLARQGFSVALWDRAAYPRDKACGEYLSPGAVAILNAGNALAGLPSAPVAGARVYTQRGRPFDGSFQRGDGLGLAIRRTALDAHLLSLASRSGVQVSEGVRFRGLRRDGDTVTADGRGPDGPLGHRCRLIVGADGAHSAVARAMGVVRPIPRYQKVAFVTHVRGVQGIADRVELHTGPDGCVGLCPGADGATNVTVVVRPSLARAAMEDLAGCIARYPALRGRFERAVWEPQVLSTDTFGHRSRRVTADGILLVGDSAGFIDPFTGEGIYFALRGAELAAEAAAAALAAGPATARALEPYERRYRATLGPRYRLCEIIQHVVSVPAALALVAARFRRRPGLADTLIRTTGDRLPPGAILSLRYALDLLA